MSHKVSEYSITYGVKTFLLNHNWEVIAYNPPGSQGTFTIPNPNKDGGYRGQLGSESPDVIAVKQDVVLVVECKPNFDLVDSRKLERLSSDRDKMAILNTLIQRVCKANDIELLGKLEFIFALAYNGKKHGLKELGFISIEVSSDFDITDLKAKSSYEDAFRARLYESAIWSDHVLGLFKN